MKSKHAAYSVPTSPIGRGGHAAPGEGLRTNDRPYPLTPALFLWERGQTSAVETWWEISNLRIVRNLLLILLAVLLLPYLLAPFYRAGHPVSTLLAWRWLKGAPVSRQWIDFVAISPLLPRSVVASEDAKFCSHRGIDWDALRDVIDDAEAGEVTRGGSTITQQ